MQKKSKRPIMAYLLIGLLLISAVFYVIQPYLNHAGQRTPTPPVTPPKSTVPQIPVPEFNADSAYALVQKQVNFGPRVPNSPAHKKCGDWYVATFKQHGLTVVEQPFQAPNFAGGTWVGRNIIAQYKPELTKRILIAAHWDSRFQADKDTKDKNKPIDGADDGASGAAVLLEIARSLAANPVNIGVDLFLIDVEDQGDDQGESETWCQGSQYWAKNLHRPNYFPYYAVLLDMVGSKGAKFYKEGVSRQAAPEVVEKVWNIANGLGYDDYFINEERGGITDDHLFIIRDAHIPMIDIVNMSGEGEHLFGNHHHTHADNINIIDKNTLKAVGQTMTALIYGTYNES